MASKARDGSSSALVRYCDDFVIGFERREDAQRVEKVLGKRMERFGLTLHPEKTRLIAFERPKAIKVAERSDGRLPAPWECWPTKMQAIQE